MKRIHLFEFEDFPWFPKWIRVCMTRFIVAMHRLVGSSNELAKLTARALKHTDSSKIFDLCSGSGGPMLEVAEILKNKYGVKDLTLTFSDLYPNLETAHMINGQSNPNLSYLTTPVNASNLDEDKKGVRTMICSMHHMKPEVARCILQNAKEAHQPICIFEMSDNSFPIWIWWIAIPSNFLMTFFVTPMIRPVTWPQIVFTYIIPILPFFIAWDGAVSNARTYSLDDMEELLKDLQADDYK